MEVDIKISSSSLLNFMECEGSKMCTNDTRISAEEMDEARKNNLAYEYLCHLKEAKMWLEAMLQEPLPSPTLLEEGLRNGVYLAKLGNVLAPKVVPKNKIYDAEQRRYKLAGLQFRHTDNINYWLKSLEFLELPKTFHPETTDIYDKKNMPRVIYCVHALSTHLFKSGKAPLVQDLYGKAEFTAEEIGAVRRDLEEYGNPLPAFQRIGGLLAKEAGQDHESVEIAIADLNRAIDKVDPVTLQAALQNPSLGLQFIEKSLMEGYGLALVKAKERKTEVMLNRSQNDSSTAEDYSDELTLPEIQGYINAVNVCWLWQQALGAAHEGDVELLMTVLCHKYLKLEAINDRFCALYLEEIRLLWEKHQDKANDLRTILDDFSCQIVKELQEAIIRANENGYRSLQITAAITSINEALAANNVQQLLTSLKTLSLKEVKHAAAPLYLEEMCADRIQCQRDLTLEEITASVRVLSNIAAITESVDAGDAEQTWSAISQPQLHFSNLDQGLCVKYWQVLKAKRTYKLAKKMACPLLTYFDIQDCIDIVHQQSEDSNQMIMCLHNLNQALENGNDEAIIRILQDPVLKFDITPDHAVVYVHFLKGKRQKKGSELWLEDAEDAISAANDEIKSVVQLCHWLLEMNSAVRRGDAKTASSLLAKSGLDTDASIILRNNHAFERLRDLGFRKSLKTLSPWVEHVTHSGHSVFLNLDKKQITWQPPTEEYQKCCYLTVQDIQGVLGLHRRQPSIESIIRLQAHCRGWLVRQKFSRTKLVKYIVKIQAWWRGILARRLYCQLKKHQSVKDPLDFYREHEKLVVKIQAFWRGCLARRAFLSLAHEAQPSFCAVRHFAKLLKDGVDDYEQELLMQNLKEQIGKTIRHNENLSQQLDAMDLKIGLLVRNRISLQDVAAHGSRLRATAASAGQLMDGKLSRSGQHIVEYYRKLFYLLQTEPHYLARLLPCLPRSKTTAFLRTVVLAIFNFGSGSREDYLLLRLFAAALQEEIRSKISSPMDVVTDKPLVLSLVVSYARQVSGQNPLKEMVGPLVEKVINNNNLSMDTNPVDIYKFWRNHQETVSGQISELPASVNPEQALNHPEIKCSLEQNVSALRHWTLAFLERITNCRDMIPYGVLYVAKVLHDSLAEKFPQAPEKDLLKVVGNFIYYHYINSAIVAPDTMDMVGGRNLSYEQRRNLASIARILQFAATKQGFGEEASYLMCLNSFIIECHEKFKNFFRHCCQVEELEDHFNVHRYTEATLIARPVINISLQEMCDTHELLVKYLSQIAPDPMDPLCELLEEMGPVPSPESLIGSSCESALCQKGMCLELVNHCELLDDDSEISRLFVSAKELLLQLLPQMEGASLLEALSCKCTGQSEDNELQRLSQLLAQLELAGLVTHTDGFQQLVTAVASDICRRGRRRQLLRKEIQMLRSTKQSLEKKTQFFEEQISYYSEYIQKCLENLNAGKRKVHIPRSEAGEKHSKASRKLKLRYSAARLHEKGILLEVDGLPAAQFRNLQFEISPSETPGIFIVSAKFMGVDMEKVDIDMQNLLQLQYEGAAVMDLFGKAKLNVNLLLFLLNRKFYSKS
ncbi:ras GTPase-activating-like protein IQGAP1 [Schistocerca piceifrons]|uniref:ras GTPase-activating-like protein IQGAP1 n=1 Tax=Schistocerca piceifrons TaxID=274613 RepID=UPI001F5F63CC|nr:ras GTPase-activating-like protein IQGAP1 [Schistocerca piceifrons]